MAAGGHGASKGRSEPQVLAVEALSVLPAVWADPGILQLYPITQYLCTIPHPEPPRPPSAQQVLASQGRYKTRVSPDPLCQARV